MGTTIVDPDAGAGYDYTSLNDWESNQQGILTEPEIATCRCTSGSEDGVSEKTNINGWTTTAAYYIKIWTDPAESYRHSGIWEDTKFRRVTGNSIVFDTDEDYIIFDGIQIDNAQTANGMALMEIGSVSSTSNKIEMKNCIFNCNSNTSWWQFSLYVGSSAINSRVYISNSLFFNGHITDNSQCAIYSRTDEYWYLHNVTVIGSYIGVRKALGTGTMYCKNVLCNGQDTGNGFVETTGTLDLNYCASEDTTATAQGGTGNRGSQTFTFVDAASDNYELDPKDDGALSYGTNLYTDVNIAITDDIKGVSRGASTTDNYDIGAFYSDSVAHVIDPNSGAGYDYSSLNTWESNEQADLTDIGLYKTSVATCRCTSGTEDSTRTSIFGWTTEAANYIKIWTDPAESYRHSGIWETGNKYRYEITDFGGTTLNIVEEYLRIEGLQLGTPSINSTADHIINVGSVAPSNEIRIEKNIIKGANDSTNTQSGLYVDDADAIVKCSNNIVYDIANAGLSYCLFSNGTLYAYNNTLIGGLFTIRDSSSNQLTAINNICDGAGTRSFYNQMNSNTGYNVVEEADTRTAYGTTQKTGTVTSASSGKLVDSGGGLSNISIGAVVEDTTDSTYASVTAIDSDIQLSISSDIFNLGTENYSIFTNKVGTVTFEGSTYLLASSDTVAIDEGVDLSEDPNYPISDDILDTTRT